MTDEATHRKIVVTGAAGFIGRHVVAALREHGPADIRPVVRDTSRGDLVAALADADAVIHLAGVNRPRDPSEFGTGNVEFTRDLCALLRAAGRPVPIVFASSTQAATANPYGVSKRAAEEALAGYASDSGAPVTIFRLPNVFGRWSRPRYNSFVATLCDAVAHGTEYHVDDPARALDLVYVDDVVAALVSASVAPPPRRAAGAVFGNVEPVFHLTVGELVQRIEALGSQRGTLCLPDMADPLTVDLYATYLSYLDAGDFAYALETHTDDRGSLAEFLKSPHIGQIFVSRTRPGVERGNHFHHTKTEKFFVLEGDAVVRFRRVESEDVIEYRVSGDQFRVVDIPPGYSHSIENVGTTELVVLFWASQIFDRARPDTYAMQVRQPELAP